MFDNMGTYSLKLEIIYKCYNICPQNNYNKCTEPKCVGNTKKPPIGPYQFKNIPDSKGNNEQSEETTITVGVASSSSLDRELIGRIYKTLKNITLPNKKHKQK